jgi:hypothetical protein
MASAPQSINLDECTPQQLEQLHQRFTEELQMLTSSMGTLKLALNKYKFSKEAINNLTVAKEESTLFSSCSASLDPLYGDFFYHIPSNAHQLHVPDSAQPKRPSSLSRAPSTSPARSSPSSRCSSMSALAISSRSLSTAHRTTLTYVDPHPTPAYCARSRRKS